MFAIICLLVLTLIFLGGIIGFYFTRDAEAGVIAALGGVGIVVIFLLFGIKVVGANEVGVPVTFGKTDTPLKSGVHLVAPWTSVETYPTRPRTREVDANIRTSQNGFVTVRFAVRWAVIEERAQDLYGQVRTGDDEEIEKKVIDPETSGSAGAFFGDLDNIEATNGVNWEANASGVESKLRQRLARYGIKVDALAIRSTNPDDATDRSISQVSQQQQATKVAEESVNTANAQKAQRIAEAEGITQAAAKFANLTPTQVQILCMQSAERVLNKFQEKGVAPFALPCQASTTSVLANAK